MMMKKLLKIILSLFLASSVLVVIKNNNWSLSQDWKDLEFELNGVVYKTPWSFDDFAANGWRITPDLNENVNPGSISDNFYLMINDNHYYEKNNYYASIDIKFENNSDEIKKMKDCDICWLVFRNLPPELYDGVDLKDIAYDFKLAKGIGWGATEAEVIAAYGDVEDKFKAQRNEMKVLQYYNLTEDNLLSVMHMVFYNDSLYVVNLYRYYVEDGYEHYGVQK